MMFRLNIQTCARRIKFSKRLQPSLNVNVNVFISERGFLRGWSDVALKGWFPRLNEVLILEGSLSVPSTSCSLWTQKEQTSSLQHSPPSLSKAVIHSLLCRFCLSLEIQIGRSLQKESEGTWSKYARSLLCWLPLVSILRPGGNTCNV